LASWPGPNTWILPMLPGAPRYLGDRHRALAVRVSAHAQVAALCRRAGPIVSTSANPSGRRPARNLYRARCYFGRQVACYLPGELSGAGRPTRIRDGRSGAVIRA
jgi:L-threonylcarbamoyladenylate synthase